MPEQRKQMEDHKSVLVVDLDGTLTPTDTLFESVVRVAKRRPGQLLYLAGGMIASRARFKERVAEQGLFSPDLVPWRQDILDWLRSEKQGGRRIVLATASHHLVADAVAKHLGLFDEVIATAGDCNLKGEAKLEAIRERVGGDFTYMGDSSADIPVWNGATAAIIAANPGRFDSVVKVPVERHFPIDSGRASAWLKAMRPHQWVKNTLIFVPLLTAFAFADPARVVSALLAFLAFSLAASATYLLNDIWDLESDRIHPRKRLRPFASGTLPIHHGIGAALLLFLAGMGVATLVSPKFVLMVLGYAALTTAYSWTIKRYIVLDAVTLAVLYTWRVLAGSIATGVMVSTWLLAFSIFIFFSLALVKRCSELVALQAAGRDASHGRDYAVHDLVVLWPLGVGASLSAVVILGLYIGSPEAAGQYASREILWLLGLALLYWISRMWIKTARGEMHDDPIVFALKNRGSRMAIMAMVVLAVMARVVRL